LEQQELQADMADLERRQQMKAQGDPWDQRDQVRIQKRLLDLQLAQVGEAPPDGAPEAAPEAAAMASPAPAIAPEAAPAVPPEAMPKAASIRKLAAQKLHFAESLGRELARSDMDKRASSNFLLTAGDRAGRSLVGMQKKALNMGTAIGAGLGGLTGL